MGGRDREHIGISEVLKGGSTAFKVTFQKMGIFWAVTMKRRGVSLVFIRRE